jgi:hypothetical protein
VAECIGANESAQATVRGIAGALFSCGGNGWVGGEIETTKSKAPNPSQMFLDRIFACPNISIVRALREFGRLGIALLLLPTFCVGLGAPSAIANTAKDRSFGCHHAALFWSSGEVSFVKGTGKQTVRTAFGQRDISNPWWTERGDSIVFDAAGGPYFVSRKTDDYQNGGYVDPSGKQFETDVEATPGTSLFRDAGNQIRTLRWADLLAEKGPEFPKDLFRLDIIGIDPVGGFLLANASVSRGPRSVPFEIFKWQWIVSIDPKTHAMTDLTTPTETELTEIVRLDPPRGRGSVPRPSVMRTAVVKTTKPRETELAVLDVVKRTQQQIFRSSSDRIVIIENAVRSPKTIVAVTQGNIDIERFNVDVISLDQHKLSFTLFEGVPLDDVAISSDGNRVAILSDRSVAWKGIREPDNRLQTVRAPRDFGRQLAFGEVWTDTDLLTWIDGSILLKDVEALVDTKAKALRKLQKRPGSTEVTRVLQPLCR